MAERKQRAKAVISSQKIDKRTELRCLAEWRSGKYSQPEIAKRHRVSKQYVQKICKGVEKDLADAVVSGLSYKSKLSQQDFETKMIIETIVEDKLMQIKFLNAASFKNISIMMTKINEDTSVSDHAIAQKAIQSAKETVVGKTPDVSVQINNQTEESPAIDAKSWIADTISTIE